MVSFGPAFYTFIGEEVFDPITGQIFGKALSARRHSPLENLKKMKN